MNPMQRRSLLTGAALLAGLGGASLAWWQHSPSEPSGGALEELWALDLELPSGQRLRFDSLRGKPLVLNFWATWCPPCIEELPLLESFYKLNVAKRWQVVGIAVDHAKAVRQFLAKMPLSFPTPVAGLAGTEMSRSLGNVSGGLPFTVVLDASGKVALRHMGKLSAAQVDGFTAIQ